MRHRIRLLQVLPTKGKLTFAMFLTLCTGVLASAQQLSITTFNVQAAGTGAGQGTVPSSLNDWGLITGYYVDSNNVEHGFVGSPGDFTDFDPPGVGGYGTFPMGINDEGATVGYYSNPNFNWIGFLRRPDGTFETRRGPNACTTSTADGCFGTGFFAINNSGLIAGDYEDENFAQHGVLMEPDGRVIGYEAPAAFLAAYQGTNYNGIGPGLNQWGAVTSLYTDENAAIHGYLRSPEGTFTAFDAPSAGTGAGQGTIPLSLNDWSGITGYYEDSNNVNHGFVGTPGAFTDFDAPGADTADAGYGTFAESVNDFGTTTGYYLDATGVYHGFVRSPDGKVTTFDAPGADLTPGDFNGTIASNINQGGVITGYYIDANNVYHGFVAVPCSHGCSESDGAATVTTGVSPATIRNPVNPAFPVMVSPKLRLMPWYRSVGAQLSK
jgi:hypothetical protein